MYGAALRRRRVQGYWIFPAIPRPLDDGGKNVKKNDPAISSAFISDYV